jgi:hypothetical protein
MRSGVFPYTTEDEKSVPQMVEKSGCKEFKEYIDKQTN